MWPCLFTRGFKRGEITRALAWERRITSVARLSLFLLFTVASCLAPDSGITLTTPLFSIAAYPWTLSTDKKTAYASPASKSWFDTTVTFPLTLGSKTMVLLEIFAISAAKALISASLILIWAEFSAKLITKTTVVRDTNTNLFNINEFIELI